MPDVTPITNMSPREYREQVLKLTLPVMAKKANYATDYLRRYESQGFPSVRFAERINAIFGMPTSIWFVRENFIKRPVEASATATTERTGSPLPTPGKPSERGNSLPHASRKDGAELPAGSSATPASISLDALRIAAGSQNGVPGIRARMSRPIRDEKNEPPNNARAGGLIGGFMALHLCSAGARIRFAQSGLPSCIVALRLFNVEAAENAVRVLSLQGELPQAEVDGTLEAFEQFLAGQGFPTRGKPDLPTYYRR